MPIESLRNSADGLKGLMSGVFPVDQGIGHWQDTALTGKMGRLSACQRDLPLSLYWERPISSWRFQEANDGKMKTSSGAQPPQGEGSIDLSWKAVNSQRVFHRLLFFIKYETENFYQY